MPTVNNVWAERENFDVQKRWQKKRKFPRKALIKCRCQRWDSNQPYWWNFLEKKKFCFAQNPTVKCIPKAKFCFYLLLVTFFYFAKMQGKFIYMRISAKFKSIFTRAQRLRPFAEMYRKCADFRFCSSLQSFAKTMNIFVTSLVSWTKYI